MTKRILLVLTLLAPFALYANVNDIQLQSLASKQISLNEVVNDGKYTLVMIWSTDCVACEEQKPMIQTFHTDYNETKANVVGIANDGMQLLDKINKLIRKNSPTYPNFVASPKTFFSEFEIATGRKFRATPTYIMFGPDGDILGVAVGKISRESLDKMVSK